MDLGMSCVNALRGIFKFLWKPVLKIGHALGLEWFLVLYVIPVMFGYRGTLFFNVSLIVSALQVGFNIYRKIHNERSINILKFCFLKLFESLKGEKAHGFVAKLNLDSLEEISGMVFGKLNRKYVTKKESEDGHSLIIGGAGSGKSTCVAIPTLMSWKYSAFVIDIKNGDLYEHTKKARGKDLIKVFNPSDEFAYGYNPFYVLDFTDDIGAAVKEIAQAIVPLPADVKDPMWIQNAQDFLTGAIIFYYLQDNNFSETMIAIKSQSPKNLVAEIMESSMQEAIIYMSTFADMADETLSGIYTEVSIKITPFATNKNLIRALGDTSCNCITPNDLENGFDVFICIEEHKLEQWKSLMTMIVNQFCKFFEQRNNNNAQPILFLLDEFPRLGRIDSVATGLTTLRSKKVEIMLFVQSKSQLDMIYGKDQAINIADNCTYKAILKASEPQTQKWCSDLVGTYDKKKISNNLNADNFGMGKGSGVSTTTEEKRIIKPEEFAYLQDIVCIFPTGYKRIGKAPYYKDPAFTNQ